MHRAGQGCSVRPKTATEQFRCQKGSSRGPGEIPSLHDRGCCTLLHLTWLCKRGCCRFLLWQPCLSPQVWDPCRHTNTAAGGLIPQEHAVLPFLAAAGPRAFPIAALPFSFTEIICNVII